MARPLEPLHSPENYRFHYPNPVRFRDTDAMGHVNNVVFLTYFENARAAYWVQLTGIKSYLEVQFILARSEIDYLNPVVMGEELKVATRLLKFGEKSFTCSYLLYSDKEIKAFGKGIMVFFDYSSGKTIPIPEKLKEKWLEYDPPFFSDV